MKQLLILFFIALYVSQQAYSQGMEAVRGDIEQIIRNKRARVGVSIAGEDPADTLTLNGALRFPMQSVFKFPIAVAILSEVDKGRLAIDQKVRINKEELLNPLWSPIRELYPQGATLTLAEILQYTVSQSDNAGCDALLRLLGGPQYVERFLKQTGLDSISIQINEETMQNNWDMQFENWCTPVSATQMLRIFFHNDGHVLSQKSYDFLWNIMKGTQTGKNRLKGKLPAGTIVGHKTGWSGQNKATGVTAAVNDIGVVFLPDGSHFFISVFVTDSYETIEINEQIIADIAKAAWDYFLVNHH